ncbi:MAG TPA: transketolase [Candidatus Ornithospirochaeta stercorigallinarum]|nr:transketolase [Candidatus Ornithospirochaeta stercorigallinarum]
MDQKTLSMLKEEALDTRIKTIECISSFGSGHIGGAMSIVEVLTYLYYDQMRIDPENPCWEDRDRLVLSKGHSGPSLYATLAKKGFFPLEWLKTLNKGGTSLPSHVDMTKTPGIDFTAGSLGQGISAALGIALGLRIQKKDAYVYAIVGDGESQEGEVWEAAELAGAQKVENLIAFTDLNGQQLDGYTEDIIPMHHLKERYETFGWDSYEIDGHSFEEIDAAVKKAKSVKGKPHMIIMHTNKSQGYIPGEGVKANHSMTVSAEQAEEAIKALKEREGAV